MIVLRAIGQVLILSAFSRALADYRRGLLRVAFTESTRAPGSRTEDVIIAWRSWNLRLRLTLPTRAAKAA